MTTALILIPTEHYRCRSHFLGWDITLEQSKNVLNDIPRLTQCKPRFIAKSHSLWNSFVHCSSVAGEGAAGGVFAQSFSVRSGACTAQVHTGAALCRPELRPLIFSTGSCLLIECIIDPTTGWERIYWEGTWALPTHLSAPRVRSDYLIILLQSFVQPCKFVWAHMYRGLVKRMSQTLKGFRLWKKKGL